MAPPLPCPNGALWKSAPRVDTASSLGVRRRYQPSDATPWTPRRKGRGEWLQCVPVTGSRSAYDDLSASWSALRGWELAREVSVQHAEPVIA